MHAHPLGTCGAAILLEKHPVWPRDEPFQLARPSHITTCILALTHARTLKIMPMKGGVAILLKERASPTRTALTHHHVHARPSHITTCSHSHTHSIAHLRLYSTHGRHRTATDHANERRRCDPPQGTPAPRRTIPTRTRRYPSR